MYVDTSILIKFFVPEPDSMTCIAKVEGERIVTSELAYAEFLAGLLRKERQGQIDEGARIRVWNSFESRISEENIFLEPLDRKIILRAHIALRCVHPQVPLRTLDALHLATAASFVAEPLFTADLRMREAARILGLPVLE